MYIKDASALFVFGHLYWHFDMENTPQPYSLDAHLPHLFTSKKLESIHQRCFFLPKNPKDVASISHKSPNGEVLIRDSSPARQSHQGCRCSNSGAAKWSCGATGPGAGRPLENGHIMGIQARIREKIMGSFGKLEDFPAFDG
jgi:hypothetical protein